MPPLPADGFNRLASAIEQALAPYGFARAGCVSNGPFGSHYADLWNGSRAYRIVWDGKESWLLAQASDCFTDASLPTWTDVALFRTAFTGSAQDVEALFPKLIGAVESHAKRSAA